MFEQDDALAAEAAGEEDDNGAWLERRTELRWPLCFSSLEATPGVSYAWAVCIPGLFSCPDALELGSFGPSWKSCRAAKGNDRFLG